MTLKMPLGIKFYYLAILQSRREKISNGRR